MIPLLLLAAAAQDAPDIVVTGRGLPDAPGDATLATVEIDAARIAASTRLEGVLADVAGLQQFRRSDSRSANPTSQGITLRGLGGNAASRALLVLDGVPQADPFGGWVAFPAYATDRIGRVRVTRGGGSGVWGPGALAGTVELDSAAPDAPLSGSAGYGSRDGVDARATAALIRPGGFLSLSTAYARGDGFAPTVAEDRGPIDGRAPYRQGLVAARGAVAVGAAELQANLSAFIDQRTRGTPFTGNRSEGADASVRLVGRGRWGWSALAYLQTRDFASSFAAIDAARTTATRTLDQFGTPATGVGARLEVAPPLGDDVSLRIGADARVVTGRTQENFTFVAGAPTRRRVAGGENRTFGLFADGAAELGRWTLALGGRVDRWTIADGFLRERPIAAGPALTDLGFATRDGTQATGRAGLAWRAGEGVSFRAAAYRGWRLPTLNELYRPFRVGADAVAPNAQLRPETLDGVEGGVTLTPAPAVSIAATLFANRLNGAVANVTAGQGPGVFPLVGFVAGTYRVRRNLDVRSDGLEVDASWRPGPWNVRASWSHVDARVRGTGLRPAQVPRDQVAATVGYDRGLAASVTLRHVSRQFEDDANTRVLAPATTLDAYLAVPLGRGLALEARGENVTDARVEAGISGADVTERATPRTLFLGLRLRPGA